MAEFKVGDRVRYTGRCLCAACEMYRGGAVIKDIEANFRALLDCPEPFDPSYRLLDNLELIEEAPKVSSEPLPLPG